MPPRSTTFLPGLDMAHRGLFAPRSIIDNTTFLGRAVTAVAFQELSPGLKTLWMVFHDEIQRHKSTNILTRTTQIALAFGAIAGVKIIWTTIKPWLIDWATQSAVIPEEHQLASIIKEWLVTNSHSSSSRHVKLTPSNFARLASEPNVARHTALHSDIFFYNGYPISFEKITASPRGVKKMANWQRLVEFSPAQESGEMLRLCTLRSFPKEIFNDFINEIQEKKAIDENSTAVATVNPNAETYGMDWIHGSKTSRPLTTIDLKDTSKAKIVEDMKHFNSEKQYYAKCGLPWHRGYLFHGPPGTGKTSTAFALASHFKKELYTLCLNEVRDEAHLKCLFSYPTAGDILLLEDVDSAGMRREQAPLKRRITNIDGSAEPHNDENRGVSLAGLLNAIDKVRNDGVILIMTTNNPEELDQALIRAGRINQKVFFPNVGRTVAGNIFERMYNNKDKKHNSEEVARLAKAFANKIPHLRLTPADIQGFLILHEDPEGAVAGVATWVEEELLLRDEGRNVRTNS